MKIALISCTKLKADHKCKARDMYQPSPLFRKAWKYINAQDYDLIFILSAKYGLLDPDNTIYPYNVTLNTMTSNERLKWAVPVADKLRAFNPVEIHFYAGKSYRTHIMKLLPGPIYVKPMGHLGIGEQLQFYTQWERNA